MSRPKDFTFDELTVLMSYYGYFLNNKGKTSGSRIEFISFDGNKPIRLHKPHGRNYLLSYQIADIMNDLMMEGSYEKK